MSAQPSTLYGRLLYGRAAPQRWLKRLRVTGAQRPFASVRCCLQRPAPRGQSQKPRSFPDPTISISVLVVVSPPFLNHIQYQRYPYRSPKERIAGKAVKGVFSPNTPFFYERARLAPYELTHVQAPPGDCAAGWAQ
eukprot:scaffold64372_cov44-Phaeocystis_antarctica.AAC.1